MKLRDTEFIKEENEKHYRLGKNTLTPIVYFIFSLALPSACFFALATFFGKPAKFNFTTTCLTVFGTVLKSDFRQVSNINL